MSLRNNVCRNKREPRKAMACDNFSSVYAKLNDFQQEVLQECIQKDKGGLSLPLGSGKTILSLLLGLHYTRNSDKKVLIIVPKTLLQSWETEIDKFFGEDRIKYQVFHTDHIKNISSWVLHADTKLVLTTADVIARAYLKLEMKNQFVDQVYMHAHGRGLYENVFRRPEKPYLAHTMGCGLLFSINWGCILVDEIQKYTNINTNRCQGIGALCSSHRWGMSGTIFDEPKIENILGFCVILDLPNEPRSLPEMQEKLYRSRRFRGLNQYLVVRDVNKAFVPPKVNEHIISHSLQDEEKILYETLKQALTRISDEAKRAQIHRNVEELKILNSQKLTMILYFRQALVCPMIPIASVIVSSCDFKNRASLSKLILNELSNLNLDAWINDENSVMSSRMKEIVNCTNKHQGDRVIVYACFTSFINLLEYFMKDIYKDQNARPIFKMSSTMSIPRRKELLKEFENSTNGILLITYTLGAEGLNLQFSSVVVLSDFWWNASKIRQAIGRIFRFGQMRDVIDVYFFTSNTGIEKILFQKQKAKLNLIDEMKSGNITTKVPKLKMDDIIRLITLSENEELMKNINFY